MLVEVKDYIDGVVKIRFWIIGNVKIDFLKLKVHCFIGKIGLRVEDYTLKDLIHLFFINYLENNLKDVFKVFKEIAEIEVLNLVISFMQVKLIKSSRRKLYLLSYANNSETKRLGLMDVLISDEVVVISI